jgi:hypothetical protein
VHNRLFIWNFLLAAVSFPIIGVDFFGHFQLMVDLAANMRAVNATLQSCDGVITHRSAFPFDGVSSGSGFFPHSHQSPITGLLSQWSTVTGHRSSVFNHRS